MSLEIGELTITDSPDQDSAFRSLEFLFDKFRRDDFDFFANTLRVKLRQVMPEGDDPEGNTYESCEMVYRTPGVRKAKAEVIRFRVRMGSGDELRTLELAECTGTSQGGWFSAEQRLKLRFGNPTSLSISLERWWSFRGDTSCPLMRIPGELRQRIFSFVTGSPVVLDLDEPEEDVMGRRSHPDMRLLFRNLPRMPKPLWKKLENPRPFTSANGDAICFYKWPKNIRICISEPINLPPPPGPRKKFSLLWVSREVRWDAMKALWEHTFYGFLSIQAMQLILPLLVEAPPFKMKNNFSLSYTNHEYLLFAGYLVTPTDPFFTLPALDRELLTLNALMRKYTVNRLHMHFKSRAYMLLYRMQNESESVARIRVVSDDPWKFLQVQSPEDNITCKAKIKQIIMTTCFNRLRNTQVTVSGDFLPNFKRVWDVMLRRTDLITPEQVDGMTKLVTSYKRKDFPLKCECPGPDHCTTPEDREDLHPALIQRILAKVR